EPVSRVSNILIGAVCHMSRDLPSATPSLMSSKTTSLASSLWAITLAQVAPTLPAPTTVIFIFVRKFKWVIRKPESKDFGRILKRIADGNIKDQVLSSPILVAEIHAVNYPAFPFGKVRFPQGEGDIQADDEKREVHA